MGNSKSKEELASAVRSGEISSSMLELQWSAHSRDGTMDAAEAFQFLRAVAERSKMDVADKDIRAIITSCSNQKGQFQHSDMLILFRRFAKEQRLDLTSTLEERLSISPKKQASTAPAYHENFLLDNRKWPSGVEDIANYVAHVRSAKPVASYLALLPREVMQNFDSSAIARSKFGVTKTWEIARNQLETASFAIRGRGIVTLHAFAEKYLRAHDLDSGEEIWRSENVALRVKGEPRTFVCLPSSGYLFFAGQKLYVFQPPSKNFIQTFPMDDRVIEDIAALQEKVYFVTWFTAAHKLQLEHVRSADSEFLIETLATLDVPKFVSDMPPPNTKFTLARTAALGDIALVMWSDSDLRVVNLHSGAVTTVDVPKGDSLHVAVTATKLMLLQYATLYVYALTDLANVAAQHYVVPPSASMPNKHRNACMRLQPNGNVTAIYRDNESSRAVTLLLVDPEGREIARRTIRESHVAFAPLGAVLCANTLLLCRSTGYLAWYDIATGEDRISEQLHDSDFRIGIAVYGDTMVSGGQYRIKCWKARE